MRTRRQHGDRAEAQAEQWLCRQGLVTLERNYRCRHGEVDLIMRHGESLVFVEVRLRCNARFGGALASVDFRKQQRLTRAAQHYLQHRPWHGPCRFDVVALDAKGVTDWIRDAFGTG